MDSTQDFRIRQAAWPDDEKPIRSIRTRVFIVEQGVPEALEWDGKDAQAMHLLAVNASGLAIGTARLFPGGRLGRMAVLPAYRGAGVGSALLQQALLLARQQGIPKISLHAQVPVVGFYQRFGFRTVGDVFEEAGIPHQAMELTVQ